MLFTLTFSVLYRNSKKHKRVIFMDKNKSKIGKVVLIILVIVVLIIIVMMFIVGKKIKILKEDFFIFY